MYLQNELCRIEITIDETYTVDSADNKHYDLTYNPNVYKRGDWSKTLAIGIDRFYEKCCIALIGDYYSYDTDYAILDGEALTILQNNTIVQIRITDGALMFCKQFECYGCNFAIYRVKDGYIIYGEIEITMLDLAFNKRWSFSGLDIFVSVSRKNCFEIGLNSIQLYDFQDNYYEIDFNGKIIMELRNQR